MVTLLIVGIVVAFAFLYIATFRLIKRTRFYRDIEVLHEQALKVPSKVKTKGDVRRLKKYQPHLRMFKRRMFSLMLLNMAIFMATYACMLVVVIAIINSLSTYSIDSPVSIPLFSAYDKEQGKVQVYVHALLLLALALVSYPISKEMKVGRPS
ncbi:MAG: hypothetical protein QXG15_02180 [Desulfurococcaceae archaeon]